MTSKSARELAAEWRSLAAAEVDQIKQREKERREALCNLHLLKDIAADAFESRKAELKGDGAAGRWFSPIRLYFHTCQDFSRLVQMPGSFRSTVSALCETCPLRLDAGDDGDPFPSEASGLVPRAPRWGLGSQEQVRDRIDGMDTF